MLKRFYPDHDFKALLFDFDGTVADTMPAHLEAWNKGLANYNLSLSRDLHLAWAGRPTKNIVQLLNEMHGVNIPAEQFLKEKEVHYYASMHAIKTITSVVDVVNHYKGNLPLAIVTGSRRKVVEATMSHLGLDNHFDLLVCAEDYTNGKPAPDCFLKAAATFSVSPQDCLVFEDAVLGVEAAHNAGMACLRVMEDQQLQIAKK
ncbi:MAG: HAD family phosphatase [Bdellovibrio sp.]|nr:HAD family phosphatase [Bdellovibrio sp.]